MRRLLAVVVALLALPAAPAAAIVGGTDAPAGKYPSVANVTISSAFGCTGTLIARDWVLTAGHCASLTGGAGIATPAAFPPSSFRVVVGTVARSGAGGEALPVDRVVVPGEYLGTQGFDTSLLHLATPARTVPTPVAGVGFEALFRPNVLTEVAGFGVTSEGGDAPSTLQEVRIPTLPDATCAARYPSSYEATTQLCAGYAEGGRDSCQGDSGGPMWSRTAAGRLLLVGATSYGDGCAKAQTPGVYARISDRVLREFIRRNAPAAVADAQAGESTVPLETYDPATRTVRQAPRPAGAPQPAGLPAPGPPPTAPQSDAPRFMASLAVDRTRRATLRSRGLRFRVRCSAACTAVLGLRVDAASARRLGRSVVGIATLERPGAGRSTGTLRVAPALARRLTALRGVRLTLGATARPDGGIAVTLRRTVVLTGR